MKKIKFPRTVFSIIVPVGLVLLIISQWYGVYNGNNGAQDGLLKDDGNFHHTEYVVEPKQKGAHVFGHIDSTNVHSLHAYHLDWVTLVGWGYQDHVDSPVLNHHNGDSAAILERNARWLDRIAFVRAAGFKVFVKPHVWISHPSDGKWRSDIFPSTPANWEIWKEKYRDFILRYASLAEQAHAEMFCVGTELARLSVEKPAYWSALIQEVRSIYSGKITYAANWYKEYEEIPFWEELDYIGVQAYFPLTDKMYPTVEQLSSGWNKHLPALTRVAEKFNRKILFTEIGYKSRADAAIKPWEWIEYSSASDSLYSVETQAHCYEAFFNTFWKKKWFAGIHIWQLRSDFRPKQDKVNLDFTPQGKPAEKYIIGRFE